MSSLAPSSLGRWMRNYFSGLTAAMPLLVASTVSAAEPDVVLLVVDPSLGLAADEVREAVAGELQSAVVLAPEPIGSNAGVLSLYRQGETRVVLSYRDPEGHQTERTFGASEDDRRTLATLALLAGNLCRDQVDERAVVEADAPPPATETLPEEANERRPEEMSSRKLPEAPAIGSERATRAPGSWAPTVGWIGVGVGGASLVTGLALRLDADGDYSELARRCGNGTCPDAMDEYRAITTQARVGTWTATFGGASLIAGIALLVFGPDEPAAEVAGARVRPLLGPGTGGLMGTF